MGGACECGTEVAFPFHRLACLECGAPCCPSCAIQLESVTYCGNCAGSLLGMAAIRSGGPFDLQ